MLKKLFVTLFVAFFSIIFIGCSATSPALYSPDKTYIPIEEVKLIELQKVKDIDKHRYEIYFKSKSTKPNINAYVNSKNTYIRPNSSIVIALPLEENSNVLTRTKKFKTEGYINKTEANIEKELLRFGFDVIDRSKFEAKLRSVRDSNNRTSVNQQNRLNYEKLKYYQREREKENLTEKEYFEKIAQLDLDSQSRKEGNKEIIDMSELIRAAQMDGVKADYIFQLNRIKESQSYPETLDLINIQEIEDYLIDNIDLDYGKGKNDIPPHLSLNVYRVLFSAKLIHVQTGKVVWTGEHELNSLHIEDMLVVFNITKKDISTQRINQGIKAENTHRLSLYNKAIHNKNQLETLYKLASQTRTYKNKKNQLNEEKKLKTDIHSLETALVSLSQEIKTINNSPLISKEKVKFSYTISPFTISPDLRRSSNQKRIQIHREQLLNKTIHSLLKTIRKDYY